MDLEKFKKELLLIHVQIKKALYKNLGHVMQLAFFKLAGWSRVCPKQIVPCLCCCCGEAVDSIIFAVAQLHRSDFNLEFETLHESTRHVVADLWKREGKISGCLKNSTSIVLQQCQNKE